MDVIDQNLMLPAVSSLYRTGYDPILLRYGTKAAAFREWQKAPMDRSTLHIHLRRQRFNVGILLSSPGKRGPPLCVLDKDGPSEEMDALLKTHGIQSPMQILTSKGVHLYFQMPDTVKEVRSRIKFLGLPLDVKVTGYTVAPPSWVSSSEWRYTYQTPLVSSHDLPLLPESFVELLNKEKKPVVRGEAQRTNGRIGNPAKYVLRIESIQGANGSAGLVRAVCVLRDAGWPPQQTFDYLVSEWNKEPRVTPPWSEIEIARCVERHFTQM